jgi:hypothetical protein
MWDFNFWRVGVFFGVAGREESFGNLVIYIFFVFFLLFYFIYLNVLFMIII